MEVEFLDIHTIVMETLPASHSGVGQTTIKVTEITPKGIGQFWHFLSVLRRTCEVINEAT